MRNEKIIKKINGKGLEIRIIRDNERDEFRVEIWKDGIHKKDADYHTKDKLAIKTAWRMAEEILN
jgi:hypothetical protein